MSSFPTGALRRPSPSTPRRRLVLPLVLALGLLPAAQELRASGPPAPDVVVPAPPPVPAPDLPEAEDILDRLFEQMDVIVAFDPIQRAYARLILEGRYLDFENPDIHEEPTVTAAFDAALAAIEPLAQARLDALRLAFIQQGGTAAAFAPVAEEVMDQLADWLDGVVEHGVENYVGHPEWLEAPFGGPEVID